MERTLDCDSQKSLCLCSPWGGAGSDILVLSFCSLTLCSRETAQTREWWLAPASKGYRAGNSSVPPSQGIPVTPQIPRDVSESFVGWESGGIMGNNLSTVSSEVWEGDKALKSIVAALSGGDWIIWLNYKFHHNLHTWPFVCAHLIWSGWSWEKGWSNTCPEQESRHPVMLLNNQVCLIKNINEISINLIV